MTKPECRHKKTCPRFDAKLCGADAETMAEHALKEKHVIDGRGQGQCQWCCGKLKGATCLKALNKAKKEK